MQSDYRDHPLFTAAQDVTRAWLRPGTGSAATLGQLAASPDGRRAAGAALVCDALDGAPSTRIALVELETGHHDIVTAGPRSDSSPKWSPDGRCIAFLSDREQAHINRLRLLDPVSHEDRPTTTVDGFVEYFHWSADGKTILLGVAGFGSDLAGVQGAMAVDLEADERPSWLPTVESSNEETPWRSAWIYDVASDTARRITPDGLNIWKSVWCGSGQIATICSDRPEETYWYSADVRLIEVASGSVRNLYQARDQLGWLTASPSGGTIAVVEAICSDRDVVAGDLRLIEVETGAVSSPDTLGADLVQLVWQGDGNLLFAGARGPDTLIGLFDRTEGSSREIWRGRESTASGSFFPEIAPYGDAPGDALFLREGFFEAPTLVILENARTRDVLSFETAEMRTATTDLGTARDVAWRAPDGLEIHGWLVTPAGPGPHPLVMQVHGGPVGFSRPLYVGRSAMMQMLLGQGYAIFQPNPRGSSGRGQAFARHVFGDMGGADTHDFLSGLDALVETGVADPQRIGVMGGSYGGFMTSWLITQDQRFAAAVSIAPVTNWVSEHLTCHIPTFCEIFLKDRIDNPAGRYFTRSPVFQAACVNTPTLNICGNLDKITPPGQATEFHNALRLAGVQSALVTYPHEGHGIRSMPALFDYVARTLDWFIAHMPAR